jgi:DNA-binding MarR family transcriptional regulator
MSMIRAVPREPRAEDLLQELYSAGLLVGLLVDEELERIDVPRALFSFIGWIAWLQPVTPGALAAETGLPPTTIRDYVRRLVERGDVLKTPNPDDGRSYHLVLTPQGVDVATRGWPAVVAAFERIESHLERPAADHLAAMRELRSAARKALASDSAELHA